MRQLLLLLLTVASLLALASGKQCFFTKKYCSNYCCTESGSPFDEFCCSDCTKGDPGDCVGPAFEIVGYVIGALIVLGILIGVGVAIACGCICTQMTGRQRYNGRLPFQSRRTVTTTVVTSQNAGGYPQTGAYPVQSGAYPTQTYPSQVAPYPAQGGAYPPQGGAYPPQGGAYPPQGGAYPPQGPGQYPSAPPDQPPPPYPGAPEAYKG